MIKYCLKFDTIDKFYIKLSEKIIMNAFQPMMETISIQSVMAQSHSPADEVPMSERCDFHQTRPNTGRTSVAFVA